MASSPLYHDLHFSTELNTPAFHLDNRGVFLLLIFFCSIVLIITLFLYAHWICRYRGLAADTATTTATMVPVQSQASSLGLDPKIINSLPIILVTTNGDNDVIIETECSICLSFFEDEEKVKVLPECNHVYHSECVDKWLSTHASCPLCRACLRAKSNIEDLHKAGTQEEESRD